MFSRKAGQQAFRSAPYEADAHNVPARRLSVAAVPLAGLDQDPTVPVRTVR